MLTPVRQLICKRKGHNWDTYSVSIGYGSNEIEQAGFCLRCKEDTHGEYPTQVTLKNKTVLKLLNYFKKERKQTIKLGDDKS